MIRKALLLKFLDAAYMQRWNDKIRPVELIELANQNCNGLILGAFLGLVDAGNGQ